MGDTAARSGVRYRGLQARAPSWEPGTASLAGVKDRLRADLYAAMKAQDRTASAALRSALAAIENAEAVEIDAGADGHDHGGSDHVAGAAAGLGTAERPRREIGDEQIAAILRDELRQHLDAAAHATAAGKPDLADENARQARVLSRYVPDPI